MKSLYILFFTLSLAFTTYAQQTEGESKPQTFNMVKRDLTGPVVTVTHPDAATRGVKMMYGMPNVEIKGFAKDESGIGGITVNGVAATLGDDGRFNCTIPLSEGDNAIVVKCTDKKQNVSESSFLINRILKGSAKYGETEQRVALVIGNASYGSAPLKNPVNDAKVISEELKKTHFEVQTVTNASYQQMKKAISEFGKRLSADKNTVGLFYYAGHGIQMKGKNYLVPTDAAIESEGDVEVYAVDLEGLLTNMEFASNRMNILILDACRNNPFGRGFRSSAGSGLATVNAPTGTIISYATAPGSTASDGTGSNGLYTQEFVKAIQTPGLQIEEVFKRVRTKVKEQSDGKQIPWENSALEGDFYFLK